MVWRSIREHGDTKTTKSRRTLALPARCVAALKDHNERQDKPMGDRLVFATSNGTAAADAVPHREITDEARGLGRRFVEAALSRNDKVAATPATP